MASFILSLLEASAIQEYIFGSNQLAQNIGASELVERATTEWLVNTLDDVFGRAKHNATWDPESGLVAGSVKDDHKVEVIYAGGGKALVLFKCDEKDAEACIKTLSRQVLKQARNLQFTAVSKPFDWVDETLTKVFEELRRETFQRKMNHASSLPMPGLGITAPCVYTGLPAVGRNADANLVGEDVAKRMRDLGEEQLISKEVADKLRAEPSGKERLKGILDEQALKDMLLVYDFDQFGEPGESSYIAVVHTDVTGMGKRFQALAKEFGTPKQNNAYVEALRKLSDATRERAKQALSQTVNSLLRRIAKGEVKAPMRRGKHYLPFRPIIFGGDDMTFVTDGRLGLELAAKYLQEFTKEPLDGQPVFARAGVAVVKTHFPFSRAYDLAEDLASQAKRPDATMLNWHFSTTGVIRSLDDIQKQDYISHKGNSMLMRPVRISPLPAPRGQWQTWQNFMKLVEAFNKDPWSEKRNKLKDLQTALRGEKEQVQLFCRNYRIAEEEMPPIEGLSSVQKNGWDGKACGYFDALEALDFMIINQPAQQEVSA